MCGLIGILSTRAVPAGPALDALTHRGPDGAGEFIHGGAWLGHRRLAIIDLSSGGVQPMTIEGCGTIVFNGEIYDHTTHRRQMEAEGIAFRTRSDTEVLLRGLARHGVEFLSRLHGMYAFAWLRPDGRSVWLGRDHAGMKPLWYWRGREGVAFSSEARSLARAAAALGETPRLSRRALLGFWRTARCRNQTAFSKERSRSHRIVSSS